MLLLVDLDGVVYRGADPVPGVAAALAERARRGDDVVYVTNNSMHYRADYLERLTGMGAPVTADRVVSSGRATALYLVEREPSVRRVLVLGAAGLRRELSDVGLDVVDARSLAEELAGTTEPPDRPGFDWIVPSSDAGADGNVAAAAHRPVDTYEAAGRPGAVVVGLDPGFNYPTLTLVADAIRAGARFIATNRDPTFPTEHGLRPGAGTLVAALEATVQMAPLTIGKPSPYLLNEAAHAVGRRADEAVMVGDGLATDIAAAHAVGARSVLMLTGVTTRAQLDALPASQRPNEVAADAAELEAALERLAGG